MISTTTTTHEDRMRTDPSTFRLSMLLLLTIVIVMPCAGRNLMAYDQGAAKTFVAQRDSARRANLSSVDDVVKRVDSLQYMIVYDYNLLRRDIDTKVVWIYVMLGIMIVASMMMYGALNQAQRQRKDLEERVFDRLSSSVAELEDKIKHVESGIKPPRRARHKKPARKRKST